MFVAATYRLPKAQCGSMTQWCLGAFGHCHISFPLSNAILFILQLQVSLLFEVEFNLVHFLAFPTLTCQLLCIHLKKYQKKETPNLEILLRAS